MVCTKEDLISIVKGQINNENEAILKAEKLVSVTQIYLQQLLGQKLTLMDFVIIGLLNNRKN